MDFNIRKKYYNLCGPYEPLDPDDFRNVDLDAIGEETGNYIRGLNWVDKLVQEIALSDKPVFKLFAGLPGSGKTTELRRLAKRLSDPEGPNLFPVFVNAEDVIDFADCFDVTDIISAIIYFTEKTILEKEGRAWEKAMDQGYFERLWNWLTETDVELDKGDFTIPSAGKLVFEMKTRPTLRQRIRKTVTSHFSGFITKAKEELIMLNERVKGKFGQSGMVVIFDSLERVRGVTSNWHEVLESAEHVFGGKAPYVRLPVDVLYTVPAALATRITDVDFLPMIKVCDQNNAPCKPESAHKPGIKAAKELIQKRIPDDILEQIFGPDTEKRVERLILWSGGYPRQILQMLQAALTLKKHPFTESMFEHILANIGNQYRMVVPGEAFEWLAKMAKAKFLTMQDDEHRRIADQMIANHVVMCYLNDKLWHDLHPAVYEIPGVRKAMGDI